MDTTMNKDKRKKKKQCLITISKPDHCKKCHKDLDAFDKLVGHKCQSCSLCPEKFDNDDQMNIHMRTVHNEAEGDAMDTTELEPCESNVSLAKIINCEVCKPSSNSQSRSMKSKMEADQEEGNIVNETKEKETHKHSSKRKTVNGPTDEVENFAGLRKRGRCKPESKKRGSSNSVDKSKSKEENKSESASLVSLIKTLPDNDYAVLLQPESTNNSNYKCPKCSKVLRGFKIAASHYTSCKGKLHKNVLVTGNEKWVCTHCNSLFTGLAEFHKHKRICSETYLHTSSVKENLLATVKESLSKSFLPFNKECSKCPQSCSLFCKNPSCQDLRKYMNSCVVSMHKLPCIDSQSGAYLYECANCLVVFTDNRLYLKHMEGTHGISEVAQRKPLLFPPAYKPIKRIKTEMPPPDPVAPEPPQSSSADPQLAGADPVLSFCRVFTNALSSEDQSALHNKNTPSSEFASSSKGATGQNPRTTNPKDSDYTVLNYLVCKCKPQKQGGSPCMECLLSPHPDVPQELLFSLFPDLMSSTRVEAANLDAFGSTLTPPVSHTGLTPPPTPDMKSARADNPDLDVSIEPASSPIFEGNRTEDEEEGGMDELQIDPEPGHEKTSDAADLPLPEEKAVEIVHVESRRLDVDAYAWVSPSDHNDVQKYVCFHCSASLDTKSLPKHLLIQHNLSRDVINASIVIPVVHQMQSSSTPFRLFS